MNINTYLEADVPIICFDVHFWLFLILFTHFRPSRTRIFRMFSRLKNGKKGAIMNINTYLEADVPIICFDVHFWLFLILFTHFRPSRTRIFRKSRVVWSIVRKFKMVFVYQCLRLVKSKWTFMTSSLKIILICNWLKKSYSSFIVWSWKAGKNPFMKDNHCNTGKIFSGILAFGCLHCFSKCQCMTDELFFISADTDKAQ